MLPSVLLCQAQALGQLHCFLFNITAMLVNMITRSSRAFGASSGIAGEGFGDCSGISDVGLGVGVGEGDGVAVGVGVGVAVGAEDGVGAGVGVGEAVAVGVGEGVVVGVGVGEDVGPGVAIASS